MVCITITALMKHITAPLIYYKTYETFHVQVFLTKCIVYRIVFSEKKNEEKFPEKLQKTNMFIINSTGSK